MSSLLWMKEIKQPITFYVFIIITMIEVNTSWKQWIENFRLFAAVDYAPVRKVRKLKMFTVKKGSVYICKSIDYVFWILQNTHYLVQGKFYYERELSRILKLYQIDFAPDWRMHKNPQLNNNNFNEKYHLKYYTTTTVYDV